MAHKLSPYFEQVLEELRRLLSDIEDDDLRLTPDEPAAHVAARMLAARWSHYRDWDAKAGPFYESGGLSAWLNADADEIDRMEAAGDLLSVTTDAGRRLFPAFQISPSGKPLPHLAEVRSVLDPALPNPLTVARWLNTPSPSRFHGRTAAQVLFAGDPEPVLAAARDDANRLAH
ncbi:hypothetical protein ACFQ9V_01050 [Leifsonia sp. NPDC056665]|uniref:hypothetical protein n=1 Tax=Leifsonia sp. NPDC056665 TaxID=3345901 RepID=UPI0036903425